MKRLFILLLVLLWVFPAFGEEAASSGAFPPLNDAGFLEEGEFVFEDEENGVWRYCSPTLKVEINRRTQEKPVQTWYEAEVWTTGEERLRMVAKNPEKRMKVQDYPYRIARENQCVLAISSDYAHLRIQRKAKAGIIIREGKVYSTRTNAKNKGTFPNLDCMALYPDGNLKVFWSNEKTAEEYLAEGATDVLSFGPWLIRDGEKNTAGLKKYGTSKAQRTAIGMVEEGHYFLMMLEGRIKRSKGAGCDFLADRLLEKGCVEAMNLDGGQTSSIVFMGHQLCKMTNRNANVASRRTAEILAVGTSSRVRSLQDPF